jgi:hypothetical protein
MPAARYWRIVGISTYGGGDLELSEVALFDGATRVDGSATLTSTFAPIAGSLADLKDADTGTTARFAAADVRLPGFALVWDFGADQNVDDLGFAGPAITTFMHAGAVQYSSNNDTWVGFGDARKSTWANSSTLWRWNPVDPNNADVSLLLYFTGADGSTTYTDDSPVAHTITRTGSVSISTSQFKSGLSSGSFNGTGGIRTGVSTAFGFGTGDYTIELFLRFNSLSFDQTVFFVGDSFPSSYRLEKSGGSTALIFRPGFDVALSTGAVLTAGVWGHVAIVRSGATTKIYYDGVERQATTSNLDYGASRRMTIGENFDQNYGVGWLNGFIDDFRVTKGVARYTANFTPPNPAFLVYDPTPLHPASAAPTAISEYPVPEPTFRTGNPSSYDTFDGGQVSIVGTVKEYATPSNVPLRRRVRLYNELERRFVRETWSDEVTGNFTFTDLRQSKYTVISYDHTGTYRALVVDQIEGVVP